MTETIARTATVLGVHDYDEPAFNADAEQHRQVVDGVRDSVTAISKAFESLGYSVRPHVGRISKSDAAAQLKDASAGAANVVYYTGHGIRHDDGYYLVTSDYDGQDSDTGIRAAAMPYLLAQKQGRKVQTSQNPTLLILDCCRSGKAGDEIYTDLYVREKVLHPNLWVWMTNGDELVPAGQFAAALLKVLTSPPEGNNQLTIAAEDVLQYVNDELQSQVEIGGWPQRVRAGAPQIEGRAPFFPNIRHVGSDLRSKSVAEIKQHWLAKLSGSANSLATSTGWYLSGGPGRLRALRELTAWIHDSEAGGLAVVTGAAGTGKSTLLAIPVALSHEGGRTRFIEDAWPDSFSRMAAEQCPVSVPVIAVHAHRLNADQVAKEIAEASGHGSTTAGELLEELRTKPVQAGTVLIIDAVDEAENPTALLAELIEPLAAHSLVRVLIGARRHSLPRQELVRLTVDLDDAAYRDSTALMTYVGQLLVALHESNEHTPYRVGPGLSHPATAAVAQAIVDKAVTSSGDTDSFMTAQVMALAVRRRDEVVDPKTSLWQDALPDSFEDALDEELVGISSDTAAASYLLEALSWARGQGLPWSTIWIPVARAIRDQRVAPQDRLPITNDDARALLDSGGAYILDDVGAGERSAFRPVHEKVAAHLRELSIGDAPSASDDTLDVERAITNALINTVPRSSAGLLQWDSAHPYVRTYLAEHAHRAGTDSFNSLLSDPGFLATADPITLTPLLSDPSQRDNPVARVYMRARTQLGPQTDANAAYLSEAALAITGQSMDFGPAAIDPIYETRWIAATTDSSILTLPVNATDLRFGTSTAGDALLATWDTEGHVQTWSPYSGAATAELATERRGVLFCGPTDPAADGWTFDSVQDDYDVRGTLRRLSDGMLVSRLRFRATDPFLTYVSRAGTPMLAAPDGHDVHIYDLKRGRRACKPLRGHVGILNGLIYGESFDRTPLIVSYSGDGMICVWNAETGTLLAGPGRWGIPHAVTQLADGTVVLAYRARNQIDFWHVGNEASGPSRVAMPSLSWKRSKLEGVAFVDQRHGDPLVLVCMDSGSFELYDYRTLSQVGGRLSGHSGELQRVAVSHDDRGRTTLATSSSDGTVRIWQIGDAQHQDARTPKGKNVTPFGMGKSATSARGFIHSQQRTPILLTVTAPDSRFTETFQSPRKARLWSLQTGAQIGKTIDFGSNDYWRPGFRLLDSKTPKLAMSKFNDLEIYDFENASQYTIRTGMSGHSTTTHWKVGADALIGCLDVEYIPSEDQEPVGHNRTLLKVWNVDTRELVVSHPMPEGSTTIGFGSVGATPAVVTTRSAGDVRRLDVHHALTGERILGGHYSSCDRAERAIVGQSHDDRNLIAVALTCDQHPEHNRTVIRQLGGDEPPVIVHAIGAIAFGRVAGIGHLLFVGDKAVTAFDTTDGSVAMSFRRRTPVEWLDMYDDSLILGDSEGVSVLRLRSNEESA